MNNPYRARPGRLRGEPSAAPIPPQSYGSQNKSSWPQATGGLQHGEIPPAMPPNVFQPQQPTSISTPPKATGDSWDWGNDNSSENGNNAWNWSVDQTHESQTQPQGPASYLQSGQTRQSSAQDNYYTNANGNNRSHLPPQSAPPQAIGNQPRAASRESTPNLLPESYSHYSNYSGKQQQVFQSPPSTIEAQLPSDSGLNVPGAPHASNNQPQWGQPPSPHLAPSSTPQDNENKNMGYHHHLGQQQHPQQSNLPQETWKNQVQSTMAPPASNYWLNSGPDNDSFDKINNQRMQMSQQHDEPQFNIPSNSPAQNIENVTRRGSHHSSPLAPQLQNENQRKPSPNNQHLATCNVFPEEVPQPPQKNQAWPTIKDNIPNQLNDNPLQHHDNCSIHYSQPLKSSLVCDTQVFPPVSKFNDVHSTSFAPSAGSVESSFINHPIIEHVKTSNIDKMSDLSFNMKQMNLEEAHKQQTVNQQKEVQPHYLQEIQLPNHRSPQLPYPSAQQQLFHDVDKTPQAPPQEQVFDSPPSASNQTQSPGVTPPQPQEQLPMFSDYSSPQVPSINHPESNYRANKPAPPTSIVRPLQEHDLLQLQKVNHQNENMSRSNSSQYMHYDQWYNDGTAQTPQVASVPQPNRYPNVNEMQLPLRKHWTPPATSTPLDPPVDISESIQPPAEFTLTSPQEDPRSDLRAPEIDPPSAFHVPHYQQPHLEQESPAVENFEFASNDRNTFLETGELTDSHHDQESVAPSQDEDNDDVPSDIPFLREVPGQSSNTELSRNDPTGQEQYTISPGSEHRNMPPGEERGDSGELIRDTGRVELDPLERRNDPSGRERSVPPSQSRNDPSGEERITPLQQSSHVHFEANEVRQVTGSGIAGTAVHPDLGNIDSGMRQIPGGISPIEVTLTASMKSDDRKSRVVTGSQEYSSMSSSMNIQETREEAVGASTREAPIIPPGSPKRRDSYEDGDDEESGNSRDESRERRERRDPRDSSPLPLENRRRYDKNYYEHMGDRPCDDDYYYDRRRGDYDRPYSSREDLDRRDTSYRSGDGGHRVDDNDDSGRRGRARGDDERDGRGMGKRDERRSRTERSDEAKRRDRDGRDYYMRDGRDSRDPRSRDFTDSDRRRRRFEDYERDHRREYYDDPYSRSSRPSSRSSYNDRDRDYYMRRDMYYGYNNGYSGYEYGPNYNANYYAYLENLRRTNPSAYMDWYNRYYANHPHHQQQQSKLSQSVVNYPEDRASVHSGQSSCDDRLCLTPSPCFGSSIKLPFSSSFGVRWTSTPSLSSKRNDSRNFYRRILRTGSGKFLTGDISLSEDQTMTSRMTPTKFSTSHVQGLFSIGSLIHVHASYPADGERAKVDILNIDSLLLHDPIVRELRSYPGPLIKGVTHKKTIIEYCEAKIKATTANDRPMNRSSYVLLYELMIMLIQQNGNVVGVDIAALLLRNKESYPYDGNEVSKDRDFHRQSSGISQRSSVAGNESSEESPVVPESGEISLDQQPRKTVEQITNEFRNTLLYGLVQEALEYAMTEGLWGHALFLASKLDKRTHALVMTRFANSLSVQDPLQTLYQLHSGRVPASVTCLADSKWDDWRPHLAMIISNTSVNPEINRKSITTMGDTMATRGDIYAAHFCYILAEIDFGNYGKSDEKIVLIGANHNKHYEDFVTLEAVMLTEIYEYARSLSESTFMLTALQTFKFENALKMIDYGLVEKGILYLEQISVNIVNSPSKFEPTFVANVYKLSEKMKFHDPVFKDSVENDISLTWLDNLAGVIGRYETGEITHDGFHSREALADPQEIQQSQERVDMQQQIQMNQWVHSNHQEYGDGGLSLMEVPSVDTTQEQWQPLPLNQQGVQYPDNSTDLHSYQFNQQQSNIPQSQQDYWGQQPTYNQHEYNDWQHQQTDSGQNYQAEQTEGDSTQMNNAWNYEPQPHISMGPSSGKQYDPLEELDAIEPMSVKKPVEGKKIEKPSDKKSSSGSSGSWLGGLFSKLTPKPKNQMILPDDNNPTIVWDPVAKKWTNKDENNEAGTSSLAPPPKATDMSQQPRVESPKPFPPQSAPNQLSSEDATTPNSSKIMTRNNMFKLQKGRGMRANYIDVMNPNASKGNISSIPTPATSPLVPMAASSPQMFIPAPVNDPDAPLNFLTPAQSAFPSQENNSHAMDNGNAVAK
ncbi:uncharacterized protein LOC135160622 isoform X2 [Diachasmimorpha longicaudata]|uniref:uncharacterized protein LOC135160622 isoform X2 n=1 Tax=Diachasmimorpha longicaudata TaxID=58733 RepID=UPI0030B8FA2B